MIGHSHDGRYRGKARVVSAAPATDRDQASPSAAVTLRASYGSADPYAVMPHIWLVSFGSLLVCVLMCRVFQKLWRA